MMRLTIETVLCYSSGNLLEVGDFSDIKSSRSTSLTGKDSAADFSTLHPVEPSSSG